MLTVENFAIICDRCKNSKVGKLLPQALYVHSYALKALDPILQRYEQNARNLLLEKDRVWDSKYDEQNQTRQSIFLSIQDKKKELMNTTLVKFATDRTKVSYLYYPDFDRDPHPKLEKSIIVDLESNKVSQKEYQNSENPPILHRKETFVTPDHPLFKEFARLTEEEVYLGLLDNSRFIGNIQQWSQLLSDLGLDFAGHHVVCPINSDYCPKKNLTIERHKAAIHRYELSRPIRVTQESELFGSETTFFDYGCGYGEDILRMREQGIVSNGWDPYYAPNNPLIKSDIVNLGYVINVIEDMNERREALIRAWDLTEKILIVSAQILVNDRQHGLMAYGDGTITNRNTFQKYYEQEELRVYINSVLKVDSIAIALGVFLVFRDSQQAEIFRASCFVSRVSSPRVYREVRNFEDYRELLTPLIKFYTLRGRLPVKGELDSEEAIKSEFRSYRRAFNLVLQATEREEWSKIAEQRRQDLLVYLALGNFKGRPSIKKVAKEIKEDAKALLGSYKQACLLADLLFVGMKSFDRIANSCQNISLGKKFNNAIAFHISALDKLPPLLRIYEGCASKVYGRLDRANIIKLYYDKPKISYLYYPNFDTVAHPVLHTTLEIDLQGSPIIYNDLSYAKNPPVLHHKECLVAPDYPLYEKFYKLTSEEIKLGLLDDIKSINRLESWLNHLKENEIKYKGHELIKL